MNPAFPGPPVIPWTGRCQQQPQSWAVAEQGWSQLQNCLGVFVISVPSTPGTKAAVFPGNVSFQPGNSSPVEKPQQQGPSCTLWMLQGRAPWFGFLQLSHPKEALPTPPASPASLHTVWWSKSFSQPKRTAVSTARGENELQWFLFPAGRWGWAGPSVKGPSGQHWDTVAELGSALFALPK